MRKVISNLADGNNRYKTISTFKLRIGGKSAKFLSGKLESSQDLERSDGLKEKLDKAVKIQS